MLVREFLDRNKTVIMPQPLYSSDLAPADFYLFLKLKIATIVEIKENSQQELLAISKSVFLRSVSWIGIKHWCKCILFELDKMVTATIEEIKGNSQQQLFGDIRKQKCFVDFIPIIFEFDKIVIDK